MVQNWVSISAFYFVYRLYIYLSIHNENWTKWRHADIWIHPSHYSVHLTLVSKRSQLRSCMADSHSFLNKHHWTFNHSSKVSIKKMHLKISSGKWRPLCPGARGVNAHVTSNLWFYTNLTLALGPERTLIKSYHKYDVICEVTVENFDLKIVYNFK